MIWRKSTMSRARPALMRLPRRSPNSLAVLLSIRPLTSTIVISPAFNSAISMRLLLPILSKPLGYCHDVVAANTGIAQLMDQRSYKMHTETADPSRPELPAGSVKDDLAWIKGCGVIAYFDNQHVICER